MSTYNYLLCPRCKHFAVKMEGMTHYFLCKDQPLAFTGDADFSMLGYCQDFLASGKRGFETKKEDHGRNRKQKKQQKESAEKNQVQRGKPRQKKQDQAAEKTLGPLFK